MGEKITHTFMQLFCEKNSDGTKNLLLKGKDLQQRIGKRLKPRDMHKVARFLFNYLDVIKADLCYNHIGDDGLKILTEEYLQYDESSLEYLNIMGCNITWKGIEYLHSIGEKLKLKTLRLSCNQLGDVGGKFVAELLGQSKTLKYLDIGDTNQTLARVQHIMSMIREDVGTNTTLEILNFSRIIPMSKLYQYDSSHFAESIGQMLKVNSNLVELHIQKNELDGHDVELMLYGLVPNQTLLLLDLGNNRIGDHGIELIANWLKKRPPLLGLNVSGNSIKNAGARALSFGMPFSKVRFLDITCNKIEDEGIVDILNSIKKPYMMRLLYIWGNKIGQSSLKILRRMLLSEVLIQELIDIKPYVVDKILFAAYYPANHYKHRYYSVMDHGCPIELRIVYNKIEEEHAQPRPLIKFENYDRYPNVDESLPPKIPPC